MKHFIKTAVVCMAVWTLTVSTVMAASLSDMRAEYYWRKSLAVMNELESYHADVAIDASTKFGELHSFVSGDYFIRPDFAAKMDNETAVIFPGIEPDVYATRQYIVEQDGNIVVYTDFEGEWTKVVVPNFKPDQWLKRTMLNSVPELIGQPGNAADYGMYFKSVKLHDETDTEAVLLLTIDSGLFIDIAKEVLGFDPSSNSHAREWELLTKSVAAVGDIDYVVTIDKRSKNVLNVYMDVSDNIKRLVSVMIDEFMAGESEKTQLRVREALGDIVMVIQADYTGFNEGQPIKVPRKALKSAVEMPLAR